MITIGRDAAIVRLKDVSILQDVNGVNREEMRILAQDQPEKPVESEQLTPPITDIRTTKRKINDRRKKDVVGLYLSKNILTSDDKLLAHEGDMVTNKLLDEAENSGVLDQI